jgi:hypothetical protein
MSLPDKTEEWYGKVIHLDEKYLLYFADKKRDMTAKELEPYKRIKSWPEKLMWKELMQADPRINPNVTEVTGRQLIDVAGLGGFIPNFDKYFDTTRRLTLVPAQGMEFFIKQRMLEKNRG